jgi:2-haloacid dehalogenase
MPIDRRGFLTGTTAVTICLGTFSTRASTSSSIKAVLFDAFPIFDTRPVNALAEKLFPGKGTELAALWRSRQFEYQWLRALSHDYADFWQVTKDSLVFACNSLKLPLTDVARTRLMNTHLMLKAWPDVRNVLHLLKEQDIRLAFLSNMTGAMLEANIRSAGLDGFFEEVISSDQIHSYKPDVHVYELGLQTLKLRREQILFVAFAGWDAAGATSFGYPTFWCNRSQAPPEQMGVLPQAVGETLDDLANYLITTP